MKIAQVAPPWIAVPPNDYGGTETVLHYLVEEQVAQGHEVTLLASADSQTSAHLVPLVDQAFHEDGVPWTAYHQELRYLRHAIAYIHQHTFDIVHTHVSSGGDMYLFPLLASLQIPHVTTLHSNLPFEPEEVPPEIEHEDFTQWAPRVPIVAISESARRHQGLPLNFIGVVHHGISLEQFQLPEQPRGDFFLWLGRFAPEKAPHLAIEAAQQAQVPIILAGTRTKDDTYYQEYIEPHARDPHIRLHGPADTEEKLALMSQARGFLNPITWEEPFGMVMIEAMASGCPVISFARGAAPEIIRDGETGFLVKDVDEMVQAIGRIDTIKRKKVQAYVQKHFSSATMARNYETIYRQVIGRFRKEETSTPA